ncbi:MAG: hypothetical protein IPG45_29755 [Deltaproteobacteria bacterium]|nr:hypothetical protein [Deltaproteobacteria bacterium]
MSDPETQKVAALVDAAKPKGTNGQLSAPEIGWARGELDKLLANRPSALQIPNEERAAFVERFQSIEAFFQNPAANLELIRRPPLLLSGKRYENVFELGKNLDVDAAVQIMRHGGYDLIVFREAPSNRFYVATNGQGRLKNALPGIEAVLGTDQFDQVQVLRVEDLNNSFFEGLFNLPRRIAEAVSDVFSGGANRATGRPPAPSVVADTTRDVVVYNGPSSVVMPKAEESGSRTPGLAMATAIGVGAVSVSTMVAAAPEAAAVLGVITMVGSLYNAFFGAFRSKDPYFILNLAGVQLGGAPLKLP